MGSESVGAQNRARSENLRCAGNDWQAAAPLRVERSPAPLPCVSTLPVMEHNECGFVELRRGADQLLLCVLRGRRCVLQRRRRGRRDGQLTRAEAKCKAAADAVQNEDNAAQERGPLHQAALEAVFKKKADLAVRDQVAELA